VEANAALMKIAERGQHKSIQMLQVYTRRGGASVKRTAIAVLACAINATTSGVLDPGT
jgi:hypothetical protein